MSIVADVMTYIDQLTEPPKMDKHEALSTLEQIRDEINGRIEALRNEIEDKTDQVYIDTGVLSPEDVRTWIAKDLR